MIVGNSTEFRTKNKLNIHPEDISGKTGSHIQLFSNIATKRGSKQNVNLNRKQKYFAR